MADFSPQSVQRESAVGPHYIQMDPHCVQTAHQQQPGPTLHANGRLQREGGTGSTVPFQTLLETVAGRNPLHHKAARGLLLGRRPILFGTVAYRWRRRTSGLRLVPWPCPQSFARSRGLNSLRSNGLGLCANNVGSEACLWAVCKQCGLIGCYCGSDVPRVCC